VHRKRQADNKRAKRSKNVTVQCGPKRFVSYEKLADKCVHVRVVCVLAVCVCAFRLCVCIYLYHSQFRQGYLSPCLPFCLLTLASRFAHHNNGTQVERDMIWLMIHRECVPTRARTSDTFATGASAVLY
jgi:hypothetical protein